MLRVKNIKTHEEIKTKNRCVYVFGQKTSAIQQHKGSLFHYNCKMTVHTNFETMHHSLTGSIQIS